MQLNESSKVSLNLFDVNGKEIVSSFEFTNQIGNLDYDLNTNNILPGVYILKAKVNGKLFNFKLIKTNGN